MTFELLVASRYLRAKRKESMISVVTIIAILGVAAGVGALVVAMAMNEGQRVDLRERLLGAQGHVKIYAAQGSIENYLEVAKKIEKVPGVLGAAPHADQGMVITSVKPLKIVQVAGVFPELDGRVSKLPENIVSGDLKNLKGTTVAIGKEMAADYHLKIGDMITVASAAAAPGPMGVEKQTVSLEIVAIFSIGLYDYDASLVYVPFEMAAYLIGDGPTATDIEVKVNDLDHSADIGQSILEALGPGFTFVDWRTSNKTTFAALQLERLGVSIAIGLIVFVASLNIVATLVMLVLEKARGIATLMAMGATVGQVRRIFVLQGLMIGSIGTTIGLVLGHVLSFLADKYWWIRLDKTVYTIDHLPFRADPWDSVIIAAAAILISFLATLYPSAAAAKVQPVEALRYE
jgi:lipoprotein-releasing system permease protein